jgi:hypothetical protein
MRKYFLLLAAFILLVTPLAAGAVNDVTLNGIVDFQLNTIDAVPVATTIYGQNGGVVSLVDVQSNYIDITLDAGSHINFNTNGTQYFQVPTFPIPAGVTIAQGNCLKDQIGITSTANAVIRLQVSSIAPNCPTGGTSLTLPTNFSVKINNGASCTASQTVTLNLLADNASQVIVSNDQNFVGANWQNFLSPQNLNWTLSSGDGLKTVYVMYKSGTNTITDKLTAIINLNSVSCEAVPPTENLQPLPGLNFGQLLKASLSTVYYYGADGKRHAFPTLNTYLTWYADFSTVQKITDEQLAQIPLGSNVTYRPGVKMLKIESDPKVYAVDSHGVLRWVTTEAIAIGLYGNNWASLVDDISVAFFINYTVGADINNVADFDHQAVTALAKDINTDKNY